MKFSFLSDSQLKNCYTLAKALATVNNPLVLRENEKPTDRKLEYAISYLLKQLQKQVQEYLKKEYQNITIIKKPEKKDLNDFIENIKKRLAQLFDDPKVRQLSDATIKVHFQEGWNKTESKIDRNIPFDYDMQGYFQKRTFDNIQGMTQDIARRLRTELSIAVAQGESMHKITKRVQRVFKVGKQRAEMIARTETASALNQGELHAHQNTGAKKTTKRWLATLDHNTCDICKRLHKKYNEKGIDMDQNFKDKISKWEGLTGPVHPNCRCSALYSSEY